MASADTIQQLEDLLERIGALQTSLKKLSTHSVSRPALKKEAHAIHKTWLPIFGVLEDDANFSGGRLERTSEGMEALRKLSLGNTPKSRYVATLKTIATCIETDILHQLIKRSGLKTTATAVAAVLLPVTHADPHMKAYLDEAVTCTENNCFRAAIILAWCATAHRIQTKLVGLGLAQLGQRFDDMKQDTGPLFKNFTRPYSFASAADVEEVSDAHLILLCRFLGWLDDSQFGQLKACLTLRNAAAHPGLYQPDQVKLHGYFADLVQLVLANPAF